MSLLDSFNEWTLQHPWLAGVTYIVAFAIACVIGWILGGR